MFSDFFTAILFTFEELTLPWEVWSSRSKRNQYFPNSNFVLGYDSVLAFIFVSPITSKAVMNAGTNNSLMF